jgi:hypothetical protein
MLNQVDGEPEAAPAALNPCRLVAEPDDLDLLMVALPANQVVVRPHPLLEDPTHAALGHGAQRTAQVTT